MEIEKTNRPGQDFRINCPICGCSTCDELVIDLIICDNCSHIFKKYPQKNINKALHLYENPIKSVREFIERVPNKNNITFIFPSMMFYSLDLHPTEFYRTQYNHYFNQMSLLIFLGRCGLKIIEQINTWDGNICKTIVHTKRES